MTVIFGHNGSGKSGYARILKNLCRSHGVVPSIRGDATSGNADNSWQVDLAYAMQPIGEAETIKTLHWKKDDESKAESDSEYLPLTRIAFFDCDVENIYVDKAREVFYSPFELQLYSELVTLSREINEQIKERIKTIKGQLPILPDITQGTKSHSIISQLKAGQLTDQIEKDIESICVLTDEETKELSRLKNKRENTPEQQRKSAESAEKIADLLASNIEKLSADNLKQLSLHYQNYQEQREQAKAGINNLAKEMPIKKGIGSEPWYEMFKAARTFAGNIYDNTMESPIASGNHCVLCHQDLHDDARKRLKQFDDFMNGELQKRADAAENEYVKSKNDILSLPALPHEEFEQNLRPYASISDNNRQQVECIVKDAKALYSRFNNIKASIEENSFDALQMVINTELNIKSDMPLLKQQIANEITRLTNSEKTDKASLSEEEQGKLSELESKKKCAEDKMHIEKYVELQKNIELLEKCKPNTRQITDQSTHREEILLSDKLQSNYENEIKKLNLEYLNVSIKKKGSQGQVMSTFEIDNLQQGCKKSDILSEGEQRALALAGFLMEANETDAGHAIIFDDPVSSLDWNRKWRIARRLAEEAQKRQIIIFTHDFAFACQLKRCVKDNNGGVEQGHFEQLWIAQNSNARGELEFGIIGENATAWVSKSVSRRLSEIENKINAQKSNQSQSDDILHQIAVQLRQTWERAIEEIAFNGTIERFSPEVKTQRLRKVYFNHAEHYDDLHQEMSLLSQITHDGPRFGGNISLTLSDLEKSWNVLNKWVNTLKQDRAN